MVGVIASVSDVTLEAALPHVKAVPFCCFRSVGFTVNLTVTAVVLLLKLAVVVLRT